MGFCRSPGVRGRHIQGDQPLGTGTGSKFSEVTPPPSNLHPWQSLEEDLQWKWEFSIHFRRFYTKIDFFLRPFCYLRCSKTKRHDMIMYAKQCELMRYGRWSRFEHVCRFVYCDLNRTDVKTYAKNIKMYYITFVTCKHLKCLLDESKKKVNTALICYFITYDKSF